MEWGETASNLATAVVSLAASLGATGVWISRVQRKRIESETGINEAERILRESQIDINLSQEARQLLEVYARDSQEARKKAAEAEKRADQAEKRARECRAQSEFYRERLEFALNFYRSLDTPVPIPTFPKRLREMETFNE